MQPYEICAYESGWNVTDLNLQAYAIWNNKAKRTTRVHTGVTWSNYNPGQQLPGKNNTRGGLPMS